VDLAPSAVIGVKTIEGDDPATERLETVPDGLEQDVLAIDQRARGSGTM